MEIITVKIILMLSLDKCPINFYKIDLQNLQIFSYFFTNLGRKMPPSKKVCRIVRGCINTTFTVFYYRKSHLNTHLQLITTLFFSNFIIFNFVILLPPSKIYSNFITKKFTLKKF